MDITILQHFIPILHSRDGTGTTGTPGQPGTPTTPTGNLLKWEDPDPANETWIIWEDENTSTETWLTWE